MEDQSITKKEIIAGKYQASLAENKIMALSMARIEMKKDKSLKAVFYPTELNRILGHDNKNLYSFLKTTGHKLSGRTIVFEDDKGGFDIFPLIKHASYKEGIFTVEFNEQLIDHMFIIEKKGFTSYELAIVNNFTNNSSFRIYELLKSEKYKSDPNINNGRVDVCYNLSELKFLIGVANAEAPEIKSTLSKMGKNIDWDIVYRKLDPCNRTYERWDNFKTKVLNVAQKELEKKSDIRFEYKGVKHGKSIGSVIFYVYPNEIKKENIICDSICYDKEEEDKQYVIHSVVHKDFYDEYINHNGLLAKDLDSFFNIVDNEDRIRQAIYMADQQGHIKNYVGWIISCLRGDFQEPIEVINGSHNKAEYINEVREEYKKDLEGAIW